MIVRKAGQCRALRIMLLPFAGRGPPFGKPARSLTHVSNSMRLSRWQQILAHVEQLLASRKYVSSAPCHIRSAMSR